MAVPDRRSHQQAEQRCRTALRFRSQMRTAPSSEPATTHLPAWSVVENAANIQYLLFVCPAAAPLSLFEKDRIKHGMGK